MVFQGKTLLADGEQVIDVPPRLSARVRMFATGQGRKSDATDAHSIALIGVRMAGLRPVVNDEQLAVLRVLVDRRRALGEDHTRMVSQLHHLLLELIPGGAKKDLSAGAVRPAGLEFGVRRRWPDIGRVHAANAGSWRTVVVQEGLEGQGNSPVKGVCVRPFSPPVVGSSPTGPTTRISMCEMAWTAQTESKRENLGWPAARLPLRTSLDGRDAQMDQGRGALPERKTLQGPQPWS
jgi:hypothetical protein